MYNKLGICVRFYMFLSVVSMLHLEIILNVSDLVRPTLVMLSSYYGIQHPTLVATFIVLGRGGGGGGINSKLA
jgi:hypothetical protein